MKGTIELTTAPGKLPKNASARVRASYFLAWCPIFISVAFAMVDGNLTWNGLLHRLAAWPAEVLSGEHIDGVIFIIAMSVISVLVYRGARQQLRITSQCIEYSSRLPSWLNFGQSSWQVERGQLATVLADLGRGSGLQGYWRLRFMTKTGERHSLLLLGWYRIGLETEKQKAWIDVGVCRGDYTEEVKALTVVTALVESGIVVTVDAAPSKVSFGSTRAGITIIIACFAALLFAAITVMNWRDLYATGLPWEFILTVGGIAGWLAWLGFRRTDVPPESKRASVLAATVVFALVAWTGAPLLNAMTSGGYQAVPYRYQGQGIFDSERSDAPRLDLSHHNVSFTPWKPGDRVVLHLRRGVLGFWQYDRDFAISAISTKSN